MYNKSEIKETYMKEGDDKNNVDEGEKKKNIRKM